MHLVNIFTVNMDKIVIRKGLFETSSSSEDSISVYQDMKLFILHKDIYQKFIDGDIYVKLNTIKPSWTAEEDCIIAANEASIKEAKIRLEQYPYDDVLYMPYFSSDALYFLDHYYTNYSIYRKILERFYDDVSFFEYENNGDIIFGYYGYREE